MKFSKPTGSDITDTATTFGGVVAGAMVSDGIVGVVFKPSGAIDATTLKSEKTKLNLIQAGMAVAGIVLGASLKGTDAITKAVKGACYGIAAKQTLNMVKGNISETSSLNDDSTASKKFIANALGLKCPSDAPTMSLAGRRMRKGVRASEFNPNFPGIQENNPVRVMNALEQAVARGNALSA